MSVKAFIFHFQNFKVSPLRIQFHYGNSLAILYIDVANRHIVEFFILTKTINNFGFTYDSNY
jgi:hypothetical protein